MSAPPTFVIYRAAVVSISVLLLLIFGLGLADIGPLHGLHVFTNDAISWFQDNTGVILP
jgi:hypothetical protein